MNKLLILTLVALISVNSYAGWKSKLAVAGGVYVVQKSVPVLLRKGGPIAMAKAKNLVKDYLKKNPEHIAMVTGYITALAIENSDITDKAVELLIDTGLINSNEKQKIKENSQDYDKAYAMAETNVKDINEDKECQKRQELKLIAYGDLAKFLSNANKPVKIYDVGSYKDLKRNEKVGDEMEHDHIPSRAAVHKFIENKLNESYSKSDYQWDNINNNLTTVEIQKTLHKLGRTYGANNSKLQIEIDAKNLKKATLKDMAYHLINSNFNINLLKPFKKVYIRNASLCLYS